MGCIVGDVWVEVWGGLGRFGAKRVGQLHFLEMENRKSVEEMQGLYSYDSVFVQVVCGSGDESRRREFARTN